MSIPLPDALNDVIGRHGIDSGLLAARGVVAALPPLFNGFIGQQFLVTGLTAGGVKG